MSLRDDLRKQLPSDLFNQVVDALGDDFSFDVVPRSRLNKVIRQRDAYKGELELLKSGTQTDDDPDDDDIDTELPVATKSKSKSRDIEKSQPFDADALRKQFEQEKADEIQKLKVQYAGLDILRENKVVDPELVLSLLDLSKVKFGDDGKLTGLTEQLEPLKASKPYLFPASQDDGASGRDRTSGGTGRASGDVQFDGVNSVAEFMKLNSTDQAKFKTTYPDQFSKFMEDFN